MRKILLLIFILANLTSKADQLGVVTLEQAIKTTIFLKQQNEIIEWVACAADAKQELIVLTNVYFIKLDYITLNLDEDSYNVRIAGFNSEGKSISYGLDLAYIYFRNETDAVNLAQHLGFYCEPCTNTFKWPFKISNSNKINLSEVETDGFKYITTGVDKCKISILIDKTSDNNIYFWLKRTNPEKISKNSKHKIIKINGDYCLTYMTINCYEKEYSWEEEIYYNSKGEVIKSNKNASLDNKIVPGSVINSIYKTICAQ